MSKGQTQTIDLSQLQVHQLNQLNQQLEQEVELFSNSLNSLKVLQGKFTESQECVQKIDKDSAGKEILVPLTSSMYVSGELTDVDSMLIDIGTGYYVEKSSEEAKEYFQRRVDYLTKQMEKLQPVLQEKFRMKQAVMEMLQLKVHSQIAQQQAPGK